MKRGAAKRAMASALVAFIFMTTMASILLVAPREAHASAEIPGNDTLDMSRISASFGPGVINNSGTDTRTNMNTRQNDDRMYYGITRDKDANSIISSGSALTSQSQYLTSADAQQNRWTYIARGNPWMWEGWRNGFNASLSRTVKSWDSRLGPISSLRADGQSAIGFKPNNPGNAVQPNTDFLIGTIRHNNYTIYTPAIYLHSDLRLSFGSGASVTLPFTNEETRNDLYTTISPRAGGAYVVVDNNVCLRNLEGGRWRNPRDLTPEKFTHRQEVNGRMTGIATPRIQRTPSSLLEQEWKCVQHVGVGNGNYDLYNRPYDAPNLWSRDDMKRYIEAHPKPRAGYMENTPWVGELFLGEYDWPDAIDIARRNPSSDDTIRLTDTTQSTTITQNGKTYRFEVHGFLPAENGVCPAQPPTGVSPSAVFTSKESTDSYGCLYGRFSEERTVTIAKTEIDPARAVPTPVAASFVVTTAGSYSPPAGATPLTASAPYVTTGSFASTRLTPRGIGSAGTVTASQRYSFRVGNSDFTISEKDLPARWSLMDVQCVNGVGDTVAVTRTERGVNFKDVGTAPSAAAAPITCTFINQYDVEKMRVEKHLEANGATSGNSTFDVDYKIVASNDGTADGNTGPLSDLPAFAPGLVINSAKIASSKNELDTAATAQAAGDGSYQLTTGDAVAAGTNKEYWIRFNVTVDSTASGYSESLLSCATTGNAAQRSGKGLFNQVRAVSGKDTDGPNNNHDCGVVPPPIPLVDIVVLKAGTQLTGVVDPNGWSDSPLSMPGTNYTYDSPRFSNVALSPLRGAEFAIYDADPAMGASPIRTLDAVSAVGGTGYAWDVQGLRRGTRYWLVETKAPAGHSLMPQPIEFTIGAGVTSSSTGITLNNPGAVTWTNGAVRTFDSSWTREGPDAVMNGGFAYMNKATLLVKDTQVGVLPKSGGLGIFPYIGASVALVGGAMVINVVTTRRRRVVA